MMAKIKKRSIVPLNWSMLKTFIDSMNCPLVTATIVGDTLELQMEDKGKFVLYRDGNWLHFKYNFNGITYDTDCYGGADRYWPVMICCSDDFFYLDITGDYWGIHPYILMYDKVSEDSCIVGTTHWRQWPHPIEGLQCYEVQSGASITYGKTLNYSAGLNSIAYCENAPILSGDVKIENDPKFISCSTITSDNVVTFKGQTYYAIGTNTLIPIDVE